MKFISNKTKQKIRKRELTNKEHFSC